MHICCNLDILGGCGDWYGRRNKPFAIMCRDVDSRRRYADPTEHELEMVTSPHRPIVLMEKVPSDITELASPGLDNIGMFLPYTGMHHVLFSTMEHDALVMTSANVPGEPMMVDNDRVLELGADYYLLHDQPIINRADDSVVRMLGDTTQFIRRSRGNMPYHIDIGHRRRRRGTGGTGEPDGLVASHGRYGRHSTSATGRKSASRIPEEA